MLFEVDDSFGGVAGNVAGGTARAVGLTYKFGPVKFSGGFMSEDQKNLGAPHQVTNPGFGGLAWTIMPTLIFYGGYHQTTVSTDKASRRGLSVLSLACLLSKRTTLHAEADHHTSIATRWSAR